MRQGEGMMRILFSFAVFVFVVVSSVFAEVALPAERGEKADKDASIPALKNTTKEDASTAGKDKAVLAGPTGPSDKKEESAPPQGKNPFKDMTEAELAERITGLIDRFEEIMDFIPGLKQEQDPGGAHFYAYKGTRLDKLDKEQLVSLYKRVTQQRTRITTERISRQLEQIRQSNQAAEVARQTALRAQIVIAPFVPPQAPYRPPQPPQPPPTTQIPRTPPPPPPQIRR